MRQVLSEFDPIPLAGHALMFLSHFIETIISNTKQICKVTQDQSEAQYNYKYYFLKAKNILIF